MRVPNFKPMPKEHKELQLNIKLTKEEVEKVRNYSYIAQAMEEKWDIIVKENKLNYYRSWTGFLIYSIDISDDGIYSATVNRCKDEYTQESDRVDKLTIEAFVMNIIGNNKRHDKLFDKAIKISSKQRRRNLKQEEKEKQKKIKFLKENFGSPKQWKEETIKAHSFHGEIPEEYLEKLNNCETWDDVIRLSKEVVPHLLR